MGILEKQRKKKLLGIIAEHRNELTFQQRSTLIGQVKAREYKGAMKGLNTLLKEVRNDNI